jgi:hypothetical protein
MMMMNQFCDAFSDIEQLTAFSASRSDFRTAFASYEATRGFLTLLGSVKHIVE